MYRRVKFVGMILIEKKGSSIVLVYATLLVAVLFAFAFASSTTGVAKMMAPVNTTNSLVYPPKDAGDAVGVWLANPAAVYCTELGYDSETIRTPDGGEQGVCRFPDDGTSCDEWEFLEGKCGVERSYCSRLGYGIETKSDGMNQFSPEYAVCIIPDGGVRGAVREVAVTDLMELGRKPASCGGDGGDIGTPKTRISSPEAESYSPLRTEKNAVAYSASKSIRPADLPSSFDWRDVEGRDWMSPVKNQASCGSCWAFAAVGGVEAKINLARNDSEFNVDLSEEYLVSTCCRTCGYGCSGGWPSLALEYVKDYGVPDEACFPYTATDSVCSDRCSDWERRLWKIDGSESVPNNEDEPSIKESLIEKGPLPTHMYWYNNTYFDEEGVLRCPGGGTLRGGHAIVTVGYNDTGGYWILKNSWGSAWNGDGYFKLKYGECDIHYSDAPYYIDLIEEANQSFAGTVEVVSGNIVTGGLNDTYRNDGVYLTLLDNCSTVNGSCSGLDARFNFSTENVSELVDSMRLLARHNSSEGVRNFSLQFWNASAGSWANASIVPGSGWRLAGYDFCDSRRECQDYRFTDNVSARYYYPPEESGTTDGVNIDFLSMEYTSESGGYCSAETLSAEDSYITGVELNDGVQYSNESIYSDFTDTTFTELRRNITYTLSVNASTNLSGSEFVRAWIDFNNDSIFSDDELIDLGNASFSGSNAFSSNFTVPADAVLSETRMRIYLHHNSTVSPCEYGTLGEVEDYTVLVVPEPCSCGSLTRDCMLVQDLEANGTCITLGADNILLDCDGFSIIGNGSESDAEHYGSGVDVSGRAGVTIQNCGIGYFNTGINANATTGSKIIGNYVYHNYYGISLNDSQDNNLTANTISSNEYQGAVFSASSGNNMTANLFRSNDVGALFSEGSVGNLITNSTFKYNGIYINLTSASSVTLLNTSHDFGDAGFADEYSNLTVQWYVRVRVESTMGTSIMGANVTVWDNASLLLWSQNTTNEGMTPWHIATEYLQNQSDCINYTPHNITIWKDLLEGTAINDSSIRYNTTLQDLSSSTTVIFTIQTPEILLVDEDLGKPYDTYYAEALSDLNISFSYWDVSADGAPIFGDLDGYRIVIWETGDEGISVLNETSRQALEEYLDTGGALFISGQDIGYGLAGRENDPEFYANYLRAQYLADNSGVDYVSGYAADPVSDGWNLTLVGGDGADNNQWPSIISPINGSVAIANYTGTDDVSALRYVGAYRLVYFAFPFEAINNETTRSGVMNNTISWLMLAPPNCNCGKLRHDCILANDLTTEEDTCVTIGAENITIDCEGHSITRMTKAGYDDGDVFGITVSDLQGMTIQNCSISNFTVGIYGSDTNYSNITSNNVSDCIEGIYLSESQDNTISENFASNNDDSGIVLESSMNNTLLGNDVLNNDVGIELYESDYNTLTDNTANHNGEAGIIVVYYSRFNNLTGSNTHYNGLNGIWVVFGSSGNSLTANNASFNGENGIEIMYWSTDTVLTANNAYNNNASGVLFYASDSSYLDTNTFIDNVQSGISSRQNSHENIVANSTISSAVSGSFHVNLTQNSSITLLNTSFDESKAGFGDTASNLTVQWYIRANVTNESLAPISQANVTVWDNTTVLIWTDETQESGLTVWHPITEYVQSQSGRLNYTPHNITVLKNDSYNSAIAFVLESATIAVIMDTTPPTVNIISPQNTTYTTHSVSLNFWSNEALSWIAYSLDGSANVTLTGNTTIDPGSNGQHSIIIFAKDASGNQANSGTLYFARNYPPPSQSVPEGSSGGLASATAVSGNRVIQTFSLVQGGEENKFIPNKDVGITMLVFVSKNRRTNVVISAEKYDDKPSGLNGTPAGAVYVFLEINKSNILDGDMDSISITFKVNKSWINESDIDPSSIALYRWFIDEGEWVKLDTKLTSEDSEYYYFSAETPGFSFFAIAGGVISKKNEEAVVVLPVCGDGSCNATTESCATCQLDCGECPTEENATGVKKENATKYVESCGNRVCGGGAENCSVCPSDCGNCPVVQPAAGSGTTLFQIIIPVIIVVVVLAAVGVFLFFSERQKLLRKNNNDKNKQR